MEWLFGRKITPEEMLRKNQRALNKAMRDLDREKQHMEQQEKKLINDIKKMAKEGQMESVKIMAKDLVRTRKYAKKFMMMKANIQAVSLKIQTLRSQNAMAEAMKGCSRAMQSMNRQMNLPQIQRILGEFEKQSEIMDMKEEMMNDAMDDAMDDVEDEDETNAVVTQVLDELGLQLGDQLASIPDPSSSMMSDKGKTPVAMPGHGGGSSNQGGGGGGGGGAVYYISVGQGQGFGQGIGPGTGIGQGQGQGFGNQPTPLYGAPNPNVGQGFGNQPEFGDNLQPPPPLYGAPNPNVGQGFDYPPGFGDNLQPGQEQGQPPPPLYGAPNPNVIPITRLPNIQGSYDGSPVITRPHENQNVNQNVGKEVFNQYANLGRPFDYNIKPLTNVHPKPFHKQNTVPPPESVNILGNSIVQSHFQYGLPEQPKKQQQFPVIHTDGKDIVQGRPYPNIKPNAPFELQQENNGQKRRPEQRPTVQQEPADYFPETLTQSEEIALKQQNIDLYRKPNENQNQGNGYNDNRNQGNNYNDNHNQGNGNTGHPSNNQGGYQEPVPQQNTGYPSNNQGGYQEAVPQQSTGYPSNNQGGYQEAVPQQNQIANDLIGQLVKQAENINNRFKQNLGDHVKINQNNDGYFKEQINNNHQQNVRNNFNQNKPAQNTDPGYNYKQPSFEERPPPVTTPHPEDAFLSSFQDFLSERTTNKPAPSGYTPSNEIKSPQPDIKYGYMDTTTYSSTPNPAFESGFRPIKNQDYQQTPAYQTPAYTEQYNPTTANNIVYNTEPFQYNTENYNNQPQVLEYTPNPALDLKPPQLRPNVEINGNVDNSLPRPNIAEVNPNIQVNTPNDVGIIYQPTQKPSFLPTPNYEPVTNPPPPPPVETVKPAYGKPDFPRKKVKRRRKPGKTRHRPQYGEENRKPTERSSVENEVTTMEYEAPTATTYVYDYQTYTPPATTLPPVTELFKQPTTVAATTPGTTTESRLKNNRYNGAKYNGTRSNRPRFSIKDLKTSTTTSTETPQVTLDENEISTTQANKFKIRYRQPSKYASKTPVSESPFLETTTTPRPKWKPPSTPSRYKSRFRIATTTTIPTPTSNDDDKEVSASYKIKQKIDLFTRRNQHRKPLEDIKDNDGNTDEDAPKEDGDIQKKNKNIYSSQKRHPYLLNKKGQPHDQNRLDDQVPSPSSAEEIVDKLQHIDTTLPTTKEETVRNEEDDEHFGNPHEINEFVNSAEREDDEAIKNRGGSHSVEKNPHAYVTDKHSYDDTRIYPTEEPEKDYILPIIRHYSSEKYGNHDKYSNHKTDKNSGKHENHKTEQHSKHENIKDIISDDRSKDYKDEDSPPNLTIVKAPWDDLSSMFDDINNHNSGPTNNHKSHKKHSSHETHHESTIDSHKNQHDSSIDSHKNHQDSSINDQYDHKAVTNGHGLSSSNPYPASSNDNSLSEPSIQQPSETVVVPKKKISSKISFTTENPILPIEAFFQFTKRDDERK
uniref:Charged multivesicular body protein 2a n=1 Tax=Cacopsylla melanoneura TaxID=428564 RepID=A0A8D8V7L2_9HEMI